MNNTILLDDKLDPPFWLDGRASPDPKNLANFRNGYLDLSTGEFHPFDPMLFILTYSDFEYVADAPEPKRWLGLLRSIWGDDTQSIELLQDWCGYLLGSDCRHQKIMLIVGPKRSGKGTIARVITAMLGKDSCCSPTLAGLSQNFGMQVLIGKRAAFITDARLSGKADQSVIAERLLTISGEDSITIDRKFKEAWTGHISARFTILSNELPRLGDASGALSSRFLLLKMTNSFYGQEDHYLSDNLIAELPGILLWALAGWRRLRQRGHFVMPESSCDTLQELEDLTSPVAAFVRDECQVGVEHWIECGELYSRWAKWCEVQGRVHPGSQATFGRDLAAAVPSIYRARGRQGDDRMYIYKGIT